MSWIDDIGQDGFFKGMAAAVKGDSSGGGAVALGDVGKAGVKDMKKFIDSIKQTTSGMNLYQAAIGGQTVALTDITETVKKLDEAIEKATDESEIAVAQDKKAQVIRAATNQALRASAVNLTVGFAKAAFTMVTGAMDFTKSLLSGQGGIESATQAALNIISAQTQVATTIGTVLSSLSGLVALLPIGRLLKIGLMALTAVLGPLITVLAEKTEELAKKGFDILSQELTKTRDNFMKLGLAGVTFAGGMGEMRAQAVAAGMRLVDFSNAMQKSTMELANMGMGMAQAAKRIGGVSGELRKGNLGKQLLNLGYSFEEQAALAAQTAANLNASGRLRSMSDKQVAETTAAYGKDLRVLQGITGEDAKKKMEEARMRSMEADLLAQAMAQGGPAAMEKLRNQLATMPEGMKKGYMEFVSTGGTAIADAATNVAITQNPKIMEQYRTMFKTLGDGEKDASAAMQETSALTAVTAQYARDNAGAFKAIGTGARLTGDGLLQGAADIYNGLILANQQFTTESVAKTRPNVEAMAKTTDALTNKVQDLEIAANDMAVTIEKGIVPYLGRFADHLRSTLQTMEDVLKQINAFMSNIKGKTDPNQLTSKTATFEQTQQALRRKAEENAKRPADNKSFADTQKELRARAEKNAMDPLKAYPDKTKQNEADRLKMPESKKDAAKTSGAMEKLTEFFSNLLGFSKGGISNRPAIFGEKGPEAAVPLPDGRSIPVTIKTSAMAQSNRLTGQDLLAGSAGLQREFQGIAAKMAPPRSTGQDLLAANADLRNDVQTMLASMAPRDKGTPSGVPSLDAMPEVLQAGFMKMLSPGTKAATELAKTTAEKNQTSTEELKNILVSQLNKQDIMIRYLRDSLDVNNQLLSVYR